MAWTIDQPIRVGDQVTNLMLGQLALEIDALHDGFVAGATTDSSSRDLVVSSLDNASGIIRTATATPSVIYSFTTGYKRKPPYLLVASVYLRRPVTGTVLGWIVRQPHIINDVGREITDTAAAYNNWLTELGYNSIISNIENAQPDAYLIADTTVTQHQQQSIIKIVTDDMPVRYTYQNGATKTLYNDFFHVALAPTGGVDTNLPVIFDVALSIIGGR